MKTLSLKLPEDLDGRLQAAASRRNWSKSEVVRKALMQFLPAEESAGGRPSFAEQAGSLVGCLDGASDLSSNPRHLSGYGKGK